MPPRSKLTGTLLPLARNWRSAVDIALRPFGISEAIAAPLIYLGRAGGGITQVELADLCGIGGSGLVRLLDRLEAMGLVERKPEPGDKRMRRLFMTAKGAALAGRLERAIDELRDRVLHGLSEDDVHTCFAVLGRMNEAIDAIRGQPEGRPDDK